MRHSQGQERRLIRPSPKSLHSSTERSQGAPILLRRPASPAEALHHCHADHEEILDEPQVYAVDLTDQAQIEQLWRTIEEEVNRLTEEGQRRSAAVMATPEEELWELWTG